MRLLVTRPREDAGGLAERLASLGHEPVVLPLLEIVFPAVPALDLSGMQALIATSRNALRALARNTAFEAAKRLPLYCVGEATAALAFEYGFSTIETGGGSGAELAPLIAKTARSEDGGLLYLTGDHIAFDLAEPLTGRGFEVSRIVLYAAQEAPGLQAALAAHLRSGLDGVILMSPRTSQIFARLLQRPDMPETSGLTCYCYSHAVAKPLASLQGLRLSVAARPAEGDLLALIGESLAA